MENLKQFVRDNLNFDTRYSFEENLNSFLDNNTIYYSDCKEFYEINPQKVIALARMEGAEIDFDEDEVHFITQVAREGLQNLVYNYMYSELEENFKKVLEKEPFDFEVWLDVWNEDGEQIEDSKVITLHTNEYELNEARDLDTLAGELLPDYVSANYGDECEFEYTVR